jgi:hypothetical protein
MGLRAWEAASDPRIPKQYRWRARQGWVILEYAAASSLKAAARRFASIARRYGSGGSDGRCTESSASSRAIRLGGSAGCRLRPPRGRYGDDVSRDGVAERAVRRVALGSLELVRWKERPDPVRPALG